MAKKSNSQDEKIEEMLHKALGRYQELLFKAANDKKDEDVYGYQQRFLRTMETGSNALKTASMFVVENYIPNIKTPISNALESFGARYGGEEIKLTTYVRMMDVLKESIEKYRQRMNEQIRERERQGKVTTVGDLRNIILDDLNNDEISVVKYGNGAKIPVDKYASMLARTTRAETENLSMIQQALREGIDLVECDIVSPTCDTCAVYQGRVYSISGNDSRYPALYKTAFKSGYSIIHPNCRHSWSPYHVELYGEEEKRQALERSNRSWKPDGDGRRFQQTETLREQYAKGQQKMRQWNAEIVEYERMKDHYGQDMPYKSLGAFRKEVRKPREQQSSTMKAWKRHYADELQYERWKEVVGTENMPKTLAKFQQIKYNRSTQEDFFLLRHYKQSVEKGDVAAISGLQNYKKQYHKIKAMICGKKFGGVEIKETSYHFVDRTVGSIYYTYTKDGNRIKHEGVSVENTLRILTEGTPRKAITDKKGRVSQKYILKGVGDVTINPISGELVQVNRDE